MIPATSTSGPALYESEHLIRYVLERLNDPAEQRASYPFLDEVLGHVDLAATDTLNGWSDPETADFREPFAEAFTVLVLTEGQLVYRRTGLSRQRSWPATDPCPRWRWELTGRVEEWVIEPCIYPTAASGTLLHAVRAVFRLLGDLQDCRSDGGSDVRFSSAMEALRWVNEFADVVHEHGMEVRFWLTPRETFQADRDSEGGILARTGDGWRRPACEIRPPAVLPEPTGKERP